jgi:hypothetical protein
MIAPDGYLDVLGYRDDPLNTALPAPADPHAPISSAMLRIWDGRDPAFVHDETVRMIEQAARREERFFQPLPPDAPPPLPVREPRQVPEALHHADTVVMRRHDGDRFRPEDLYLRSGLEAAWTISGREAAADTFLIRYDEADEAERERDQRSLMRRARRAIARVIGGT